MQYIESEEKKNKAARVELKASMFRKKKSDSSMSPCDTLRWRQRSLTIKVIAAENRLALRYNVLHTKNATDNFENFIQTRADKGSVQHARTLKNWANLSSPILRAISLNSSTDIHIIARRGRPDSRYLLVLKKRKPTKQVVNVTQC